MFEKLAVMIQNGPCHGSGGWSPASHRGGPGSIPGKSTWNLWWTKQIGTGFTPSISIFPYHYNSKNAPYPFIHLHRRHIISAIDSVVKNIVKYKTNGTDQLQRCGAREAECSHFIIQNMC